MAVVFGPDSFTVGSDIDLDDYPSGSPDYTMFWGLGSNLRVIASTDKVTSQSTSDQLQAYISHAGMPTGDQSIKADVSFADDYSSGQVNARMSTTSEDLYAAKIQAVSPDEIYLYRYDDSIGWSELAVGDAGLGASGSCTIELIVTGTNPVHLVVKVNGSTIITYDDYSGYRKTSGLPGVGVWTSSTACWFDNVIVDDLTAGVSKVYGTAAGNGALAGRIKGITHLSSSTSGTGTLSSTSKGKTHLKVSSSGVGSVSGTIASRSHLATQLAGSGAFSGSVSAIGTRLYGSLQGVGSLAGTMKGLSHLSCSADGTGSFAGNIKGIGRLSATGEGAGLFSGKLTGVGGIKSSWSGIGTLSAAGQTLSTVPTVVLLGAGSLTGTLRQPSGAAGYLASLPGFPRLGVNLASKRYQIKIGR